MSNENKVDIINPATGEKIGESPLHSSEDIFELVKKAKEVQPEWEKTPLKKRIALLKPISGYIADNADKLAAIISNDNGKTRIDALSAELLPAAMAVNYYCKKAPYFLRHQTPGYGNIFTSNKQAEIYRRPFGVTGIISPWNYPFAIPFSEVIMSLLAGNCVILKTASETQGVGLALKEVIESAGLPEYVFNYVNVPGRIAGDAFIDAGVDKLFFTGSVAVGKILMKKASEKLTPLSLELGGNDPMIVCEDADIYRAAKGAVWGGYQNAGQSCGGVERIYVHEKVYDAFMKQFKHETENLRVGNDVNFRTDIGCITTSKQVETINSHIEDALQKGAEIFAKSKSVETNPQFLPAVVLTGVNHSMLVMQDETFGPVTGVMKFSSYEEAINLANDSYLGLTASVWTKSNSRGRKIGAQIKAGAVMINDHLMSHGLPETPWGGFKQSGLGRTHGNIGFDEMTQPQVIITDRMPGLKKNMWWHPHDKSIYDGMAGLINMLYSRKTSKRLNGLTKLMKIVPRMFKKD